MFSQIKKQPKAFVNPKIGSRVSQLSGMSSSRIQTRSRTKEALLSNQQAVIKRKRPASQVFEDTDMDEPGSTQLEIPDHLYYFIQQALDLEKQLQTSKKPAVMRSELKNVELIIANVTKYYILCEFFPSGWKYNRATAHTLVPKEFPTKKKFHTQENVTPNPCIQYVQLDERKMEAWRKFKEKDAAAKITAHDSICYPIDKKTITPLSKGLDLFCIIGDYAVQTFNKSYQMYVNKETNENIKSAQFVKSYYHKLSSSYLFCMTIKATEQGYAGSYEATVECGFKDGAITLDKFVLKHHKPPNCWHAGLLRSMYETVKDRSSDPEACYEVTGMVRRRTKWGGYDFHNPNGWNRWNKF